LRHCTESNIMKLKILLSLSLIFTVFTTAAAATPEIHCKHFIYGYPLGGPDSNDLIIRDLYALSSNDTTKFADWVAYRLDSAAITGKSIKKRKWKADPWLEENETLEPDDYKKANKKLKTDRGHQAPLASFKGYRNFYEANYLSNITPQKAALNQGPWKKLEEAVRRLVKEVGEVYVMTGPIYNDAGSLKLPEADETHIIPSAYWKIIVIDNKQHKPYVVAYIFDQNTPRRDKVMKHLTTVDEVENQTGFDFFRLLDDKTEDIIENKKNSALAKKYFNK
jgi:endonuclease G